MRYLTPLLAFLLLLPELLFAQDDVVVDPADLVGNLDGDWTTYSGDYSGRRYSNLTQVNKDNVTNLTLA
ncbi:MAG: acido-empty-quinoprotein group A, partial [Gammaproteobacteria bacterium]|nr:acido-empty-quinoprotein group A [Gammaproteobacteria bacterium]